MENITIQTSQNVGINYRASSVGDRLLALMVDYLIIWITLGIIYGILAALGILEKWLMIIMYIPFVFYALLFETFMNGQTPGKIMMKLKVVKLDGSQVSFGSYFIRWVFRLVEIYLTSGILGLLSIVFSKKSQRLGDRVAGTAVVKIKPAATLEETIYMELPEDYKVHFKQAEQLSDKDAQIIREVIDSYRDDSHNDKTIILIHKTKTILGKKLNIESNMPPYQFLYTLLKDYNFLNR